MELMWDLEILLMIPFTDIIEYPDEFNDNYFENKLFKKIRDYLNIDIDVYSIMETIGYNQGKREKFAISIYYSVDSFKKYILLDTYLGSTDQLEFIYIGFGCPKEQGEELRKMVRTFYDESCKYNVYYCEGTNPIGYKYQKNFNEFESLQRDMDFKAIQGKKYIFYKGQELLLQIS